MLVQTIAAVYKPFLDPETGLQALLTLFLLLGFLLFQIFNVLRLFHFTTDRINFAHTIGDNILNNRTVSNFQDKALLISRPNN